MKLQCPFILALLCISFNAIIAQNTISVPADQPTIQAALNAAKEGTTIVVAPGTYFENLNWPDTIDGISLIGDQGKDQTIIDGRGLNRVISMNSNFISIYTPATMLQGFTLQNGYVHNENGAGLQLINGSPTIRDIIFKQNVGEGESVYGAGAFISQFGGTIERCEFVENEINSSLRANGAGLFLQILNEAKILNCLFENNHGTSMGWTLGGGFYVESWLSDTSILHVKNCTIRNNSTTSDKWSHGGGSHLFRVIVEIDSSSFEDNLTNVDARWGYGGALYINSAQTEISSSSFDSNESESGAGIFIDDASFNTNAQFLIAGSTLSNHIGAALLVQSSPTDLTVQNCVIDHNDGPSIIYSERLAGGNFTLNHCTIAFNSGPVQVDNSTIQATNSIFWNNTSSEFSSWPDEPNTLLRNCVIKNGYAGEFIISANPEFLDEYVLVPKENSPCLSAGIPVNINIDIKGAARPLPANSYPDIGAYEIDQYFAHVHVRFFLDENQNGTKDTTEHFSSLGSVLVDDQTSYNNFRKEGIIVIAQQGLIKLNYNQSWDPLWGITNQSEYTFLVDTDDFSEVIEFGLAPVTEVSDLKTLITSEAFRCGEEINFTLSLKNQGTIKEEGIVWLQLDNRVEDYTFPLAPNHIISDHDVGWDFSELLPGECLNIDFFVTAPLIDSAAQVGELYCFIAALPSMNRENGFVYKTELRCSFDPNDKLLNPFRSDGLNLVNKDLLYTIRFQNTGNDFARNVVVVDTIDSNLDMSTFEIVNCSHPERLQVIINDEAANDKAAITFSFNDIHLPDSFTNETASHGFVNYSIKPLEDVELNTMINNTAYIYFDFNPAIVTNTVTCVLVDKFPTVNTSDLTRLLIRSHPNPASNIIYLSRTVDIVKVFDTQGKLMKKVRNKSFIEVNELPIGSYFVEYEVDKKLGSDTWVIAR